MEEKYKLMTEQLRLTYSDEDVANYIRWIIKSDTAKEYWSAKADSKCSIHGCSKVCSQCDNDTMPM